MNKERQFPGRDHWQLWVAVAAFCLVALWFVWRVLWPAATALTHGFGAYYSASRLLSGGELSADIYDPAYFRPIVQQDSQGQINDIYNANLPTTTLMFWPLSFLPIRQARLVWTFANVAFLAAGLGLLLSAFGIPLRERRYWPVGLLVFTIGLLLRPVVQNFMLGQAYVLVFFLFSITTAAFFKTQPPITEQEVRSKRQEARSKSSYPSPITQLPNYPITQSAGAISLALSLLLKTAGWPLLILLLWLRKGWFLAWGVGFGLLVFLVTLPIFPLEMWTAFGRLLSQVGRSPFICVPAYQTTRSWLCHLFAPGVFWQEAETAEIAIPAPATAAYFVLGAVCLLVLLRLARRRPAAAFIGFVCWGILFLPLGEVHHHTVMLIPLVWFVAGWPRYNWIGRMIVVLAAVCYLLPFPVNTPQLQSGWLSLLAYPYLAAAWLIFLGVLKEGRASTGLRQGFDRLNPR
jgi:hypothetical protein